MVVLHLFSEAMDVIEPGQEIGVTVAQFAGSASSRSVTQQIPLNHSQCGEILLNTDQAREQAGLRRLRRRR